MAFPCRGFCSRYQSWFGKFVDLATTTSVFDEMLPENLDDIPKAFFYMVKGLSDVKEKAVNLTAATAK